MDVDMIITLVEIIAVIIFFLWKHSKRKEKEAKIRYLLSRPLVTSQERAEKVRIVLCSIEKDDKYKDLTSAEREAKANEIADQHLWSDWWFNDLKAKNEKEGQ